MTIHAETETALERARGRLVGIYGATVGLPLASAVAALARAYAGRIPPRAAGWSERDALLITYGDSVRGAGTPLAALRGLLRRQVGNLVTFVHLLPFYPFSSDDGFAVEDFRAVRPDLGTWDDVARLAEDYRLAFDGVINHASASGGYARGYFAGDPAYADFFIALDPATDTSRVLRTRNLPLLHEYATAAGPRWLWTTFSRDQLDLNLRNPRVLLELLDVLLGYAARGASLVRLDAIPYLWKEPGTSCAHLPQTHALIKVIRDVYDAAAPHVLLLTETNVPHRENVAYFGDRGDEAQMIYNFSLAPLILWSLARGDAAALTDWARGVRRIGPKATYLNITATHDGIGMRPTEGLLDEPARAALVQRARDHGGDVTGKRNADGTLSPYELNINYFDAVNDPRAVEPPAVPVRRFLVSQAIPLAFLGLPGLYIHSLFGSRNDYDGVRRTGRARSINRAQLDSAALERELAAPASLRAQVFGGIARLLTARQAEPAFHPDAEQEVLAAGTPVFALRRWPAAGAPVLALHNVSGQATEVTVPGFAGGRDIVSGARVPGGALRLAPYDVLWVREGDGASRDASVSGQNRRLN